MATAAGKRWLTAPGSRHDWLAHSMTIPTITQRGRTFQRSQLALCCQTCPFLVLQVTLQSETSARLLAVVRAAYLQPLQPV